MYKCKILLLSKCRALPHLRFGTIPGVELPAHALHEGLFSNLAFALGERPCRSGTPTALILPAAAETELPAALSS
jgi:hypothetical protein